MNTEAVIYGLLGACHVFAGVVFAWHSDPIAALAQTAAGLMWVGLAVYKTVSSGMKPVKATKATK